MGILFVPPTYSFLPLTGNTRISDHHKFYKGINQWIVSLLRLQLQTETVRGFPRNVEGYFNSTNENH
jgi:hypothetical protein